MEGKVDIALVAGEPAEASAGIFTAVMQAGGRFIGSTPDEVRRVHAKHNYLKPITAPAGAYQGQTESVNSVGPWSFILARASLPDDIAYRIAATTR